MTIKTEYSLKSLLYTFAVFIYIVSLKDYRWNIAVEYFCIFIYTVLFQNITSKWTDLKNKMISIFIMRVCIDWKSEDLLITMNHKIWILGSNYTKGFRIYDVLFLHEAKHLEILATHQRVDIFFQ